MELKQTSWHGLNHTCVSRVSLLLQMPSWLLHVWWHQCLVPASWTSAVIQYQQLTFSLIKWSLCALLGPRLGLTAEVWMSKSRSSWDLLSWEDGTKRHKPGFYQRWSLVSAKKIQINKSSIDSWGLWSHQTPHTEGGLKRFLHVTAWYISRRVVTRELNESLLEPEEDTVRGGVSHQSLHEHWL